MAFAPEQFQRALTAELSAALGASPMTVTTLAARSGIHRVTMSRYLNNQRDIPVTALYAIAITLDLPVRTLVTLAEERLERTNS